MLKHQTAQSIESTLQPTTPIHETLHVVVEPEIEQAAQREVAAQLLHAQNKGLEDKVKEKTAATLADIEGSLHELYSDFRRMEEKPRRYEGRGLSVELDRSGLHIEFAKDGFGFVHVDYAPKKLERLLGGTTEKLRIGVDLYRKSGVNESYPRLIARLTRATAFAGAGYAMIGSALLYTGTSDLAAAGLCFGSLLAVAATPTVVHVMKETVAKYRREHNIEQHLTGAEAIRDAVNALPILYRAKEVVDETMEQTSEMECRKKTYRDDIEVLEQRNAELTRLLESTPERSATYASKIGRTNA